MIVGLFTASAALPYVNNVIYNPILSQNLAMLIKSLS